MKRNNSALCTVWMVLGFVTLLLMQVYIFLTERERKKMKTWLSEYAEMCDDNEATYEGYGKLLKLKDEQIKALKQENAALEASHKLKEKMLKEHNSED